MKLYHGSIIKVDTPEILTGEIGRDFGFAFYTTDIQEQAERWAIRKAKIGNRKSSVKNRAIVSVFDWDEELTRSLNIKRYDGPSMEWLEMVIQCRGDAAFTHSYDIVIGNIANDNVGETVLYVMQGIMRKEDAIERLKFEKINNQIAFCSLNAIKTLHFQESYECKDVTSI